MAHSLSARPVVVVAVVTVTAGYRHESIPVAEEVLRGMIDAEFFRDANDLQRFRPADFDVVMFVNTTGELPIDVHALVSWVRGGGKFIGVHSAADTFHGSDEYIEMLGGEFDWHGPEITAHITGDAEVTLFEEYYHFKRFDPRNHVLLAAGTMPLAWRRDFGKGSVFYTALGHREDVWRSAFFRQHLARAIHAVSGTT